MLSTSQSQLMKSLPVKNHDHKSPSHLPLNEAEEPPIDSTIPINFINSVKLHGDLKFMAYRCGLSTNSKQLVDEYVHFTYKQSTSYILSIISQLNQLGMKRGDRCVIYAKNSPLWFLTDVAIAFADGVSAPIYDTLGIDNIQYCIDLVKARFVFVSVDYVGNVLGLLPQLPSVEKIICFDNLTKQDKPNVLQQAKLIYYHITEHGTLIDDSKSLYSISYTPNQQSTPEQEIAENAEEIIPEYLNKLIQGEEIGQNQLLSISLPKQLQDQTDELEKMIITDQQPKQMNSIIFTSGTSGYPKAVAASHSNVISGGATLGRQYVPYGNADRIPQSTFLSYLPLAHVFERNMEHLASYRGYCIYYSSGNIKLLTADLLAAKPTFFIGVPRVFQKIYDGVQDILKKKSAIERGVFKVMYNIKKLYLDTFLSAHRYGTLALCDKIAFKQIQDKLGGQVEYIVSGSSALPQNVKEFLEVCSGARLAIGYGLTECSCSGLYNYSGQKFNQPNQLGFVCWDTEGIVVDVSDQCEYSLEKDRIGELCLKGRCIAMGYVEGSIDNIVPLIDSNGFYHTGDLVVVNQDGSAGFIRRIALVVKLQHGEFVDLELIETSLEKSPLITSAFVHAEAQVSAPVTIVCVDRKVLESRMSIKAVEDFLAGNIADVNKFVEQEGEKQVRTAGLKGFNVPKAYKVLLDTDWTTNTDLYTPSSKKRHSNFRKIYKNDLDRLFAQVDSQNVVKQSSSKVTLIIIVTIVVAITALILKFVL